MVYPIFVSRSMKTITEDDTKFPLIYGEGKRVCKHNEIYRLWLQESKNDSK